MAKFRVKLFGALQLETPDGTRASVPGAKQQALLSILAASLNEPVTRDRLIGLLWGDRFPEQARQSLRQGISKLRQFLNHGEACGLFADNDRVALDPELVSVDLSDFRALTRQNTPEADEQAITLYRANLLDGLFVRETAFEEWLTAERTHVNQLAFPVFERLAASKLKSGEQAESLKVAQQLVSLDPLRESSHRLLMRLLAQSGQRSAAIQQYQKCTDILKAELDVEPDPATKNVLAEIKSPAPPAKVEPSITQVSTPMSPSSEGSSKVRIIVLPLQHMGASSDLPAFASGLSEDLTTALTRYRWLDVMADVHASTDMPSVSQLRQAALQDGVVYTVEGSVRQLGDTMRITAQLVELSSGKYVSVHRYDRSTGDIAALLDEVSETAAATIESELVAFEGEKARKLSGDAMGAWDCYHLGLSTQYEFSTEGNARAQALFRRAIELDPSFSAAYARLSYAMVLSAIYFDAAPSPGLLDEALELARTATRLDDQDAIARFALGRIHLARGEYDRSVMELKQAIDMNSSLAQAYCGLGDSLAYMGRAEEAIPHFEEAVRLSPHDPHRWAFSMYGAIAHIFAERYELAVDWALAAIRVPNSHFWANSALVSALGHLGRLDEAGAAMKELLSVKPDFSCDYVRERLFYLTDAEQIERYVEGLLLAGAPESSA